MKGFSKDIEGAIDTIIEGLEYNIDISSIEAHKVKSLMRSKVDSFRHAKKMIDKWQNSQNQPSETKFKKYVSRLVDAGDKALQTLRSHFNAKINFDEIDEDKHYLATEGKVILHQAITEIDASLIELRMQIDANKIELSDREFKIGFAEKFANQEFYPENQYHKDWYSKEHDAVIICPKGTIGKLIILDELRILLPKVPENKEEILFYSERKRNQYWRRTPMPKNLTKDNEDSYYEYIMEEFRRRREGIWFMNNGEPVYLTGAYYFSLQWGRMQDNDGYMDFRYAQLNMFYHTEACVRDKRCLGQIFVKSRRTGYTYEKLFRMLHESTSTRNANFGITSKNDTDAKKAFSKFSYGFRNLPFFFRPVVKGRVDSLKFLEFSKPSDGSKEAKKKNDTNTDAYLNTYIDYEATKDDAYDGQKMYRYLGDEAGKWKKPANYLNHWGQIYPTFDEGGKIVGKAFIGSTVGARSKGGQEFVELLNGSKISKRNKTTGRTPTGMYSYFLPAQENMTEFTDKYGVCHKTIESGGVFENVEGELKRIGSVQYLEAQNAQKRKQNEIAYNEQLRAFPMKLEDAIRDESAECLFSLEKIQEQINYCEDTDFADIVKTGYFAWEDGIRDSTVVWHPVEKESSQAKFNVTWIPPEHLQNNFENKIGYGGVSKAPLNGNLGAFGCDSYDISGTVDSVTKYGDSNNRGSKGALHGVTGLTMGDAPSNHFFLEYIARPKTAEIFYEDVLMACVFYGMPILAENNKPRLLYHFKNRGYRNFSLTRFDKPLNRLSITEKELGGMPNSSSDVMLMHSSAIESYIEKYVGYNLETNDFGNMYFKHTLNDWKNFDINKRTKYDATISSGLALMAVDRNKYNPKSEKTTTIRMNIKRKVR